jgi:hypothetical protein
MIIVEGAFALALTHVRERGTGAVFWLFVNSG